ncbi:hypothetical protein HZH68_015253 [Vespula germanica]|uniref:BESS domain-containing protein n=1 Tax=Vespula germanica TaxID=30212 RepID=A0A834J8F0_VESGE|nr:hypothetical protein HZH68_015253 [Vespula germanica]
MFDTERFIEEIEKRPAIYDVNRSEYNDRNAKMSAWEEVCQVMVPNWTRLSDEERNMEVQTAATEVPETGFGTPEAEKVHVLRSTAFSHAHRNQCKSEESEGEGDNPVIEESDVPLAHAVPSLTTGREYVQTGASFKMCPRYPKQLCETSLTSFDNEIHDILSSHSGQRVAIDEEDYDKMFLLSLLPTIRQIPEEKKLDVRIQMQQVLASALRVSLVTRKMGASVNPVVELTENDGTYILKTNSPFKSSEIKFKLGEEFEEETPDGRKVKSVCTLEGNKLLHVQKGEKETTIEREFTPTEMKAVMKVDDIVCTRVYTIQN